MLSLFHGLQEIFDLTWMVISHDHLAVVRTMCRRVAVMYLGGIPPIPRSSGYLSVVFRNSAILIAYSLQVSIDRLR